MIAKFHVMDLQDSIDGSLDISYQRLFFWAMGSSQIDGRTLMEIYTGLGLN